jgi:hypothetical protein
MDRHLQEGILSADCEQRLADIAALAGGRPRRSLPEPVVSV